MILSGQISSSAGSGTETVCVEFEDGFPYNISFFDEKGNILSPEEKNYIPKDSYIYLMGWDRAPDAKVEKEWSYWITDPPMVNRPFKFKITKNVTIPITILTEWNEFTGENGIISYDTLDSETFNSLGISILSSTCNARGEYYSTSEAPFTLTEESKTILRNLRNKDVIIAFVSGTNYEIESGFLSDFVPSLQQGMATYSLSAGAVCINHAKKEIASSISDLTNTKLICIIISDQESCIKMTYNNISAIIIYSPLQTFVDFSRITYIKNSSNSVPAEFGAQIADLIHIAYTKKASGYDLYDIMQSET